MKLDPVTLEILGNKMTATTEEMGITLQRTGRTLYVKETADFGTALAGLDGKFFAYPHGIGVCGFIDLDCAQTIGAVPDLEPDDVIVTNHPYDSGGLSTHTPDVHLVKPYFYNGKVVAYGWAFVHLSDMGGRVPSSISPSNTELYQEGLLIPPLRLMRRGTFVPEVVSLLKANVRTPKDNYGDVKAMLAALAVGERRTVEMIDKFGLDTFVQAQSDIVEYAGRKARTILRRIPDGSYEFWDYLDDDASTGIPLRLRIAMTVTDGEIELDFTGTDPQTMAPYNIPTGGSRHAWLTLRLVAFIYSHDKTVPLNAGLFKSVRVITPPGTLINPEFPAPVGIRHATALRLYETLNGALARALPKAMPACNGGVLIPVVLAEHDTESGGSNVLVVEPMVGGMGARYGHDGVDGRDSSIANLGNNPIESVEASAAIVVRDYALRPDSGGPGKWRGGTGLALTFEVLRDGGQVLGRGMDRFRFAPWGLAGGRPGCRARTIQNLSRVDERDLGKIDVTRVNAKDTITILTPGGGGYGDPLDRSPAKVFQDVILGLVTPEGAARDYGVIVADGQIDLAETKKRRSMMRDQLSPQLFEFGSEREAWERVFDDAMMAAVNDRILAAPVAIRPEERLRLFRTAVPALVQDAEIVGALGADRDAQMRLWSMLQQKAAE